MRMQRRLWALSIAAFALAPGSSVAQGIGIGARLGTLGLGGEAAVDLTDRLALRAGLGLSPIEPSATFDDLHVALTLPTWYNVGLDVYLNGAVRLGAGILFKSEDPELTGEFNAPQDVGGVTFTPEELGTLTGVIDSSDRVPYLLVGFGKHTAPGVGLFLDLGVAFLGDPEVRLGARGGTISDQQEPLRTALDQEEDDFESDMHTYLEFWPIVSLGLRIGLG
ncbi:MAG TPA: hypothetical protein VLA09_05640 [Longimicrobiales bacterium]|nr:hypothetical protein [Longimicrobiales bacterium]